MEDVTDKLLYELQYAARGEDVKRALRAAPAKKLTPALEAEIAYLQDPRTDLTMGRLSNVLAYSDMFRHNKKRHTNLIRLMKGGFVRVFQHNGSPPDGSRAAHEARYTHGYYTIDIVP